MQSNGKLLYSKNSIRSNKYEKRNFGGILALQYKTETSAQLPLYILIKHNLAVTSVTIFNIQPRKGKTHEKCYNTRSFYNKSHHNSL